MKMKKHALLLFIVTAFLLFSSNVGLAQDNAGKFGVGARVAYVNYSDDEYDIFGLDIDEKPDDAAMYGGNLTYFFHKYFSVELSVDYVSTDVEVSALGMSTDVGELTQVPVLLTGRMHFSTNPKVSPYLGGGVGYYFNDFDSKRAVAESIYGPGAKMDVDDSVGYHVDGGVEVFVTEHAAINLDIKYTWNEIEFSVNVPGFDDEEVEANAFIAGAGIKYYF
jgi:outer membrane protein